MVEVKTDSEVVVLVAVAEVSFTESLFLEVDRPIEAKKDPSFNFKKELLFDSFAADLFVLTVAASVAVVVIGDTDGDNLI